MIPTMILFGLIFGRWWRASLLAGAVLWSILLFSDGTIEARDVLTAGGLSLINTAVGVVIHQSFLRLAGFASSPDA